MAWKVVFVAEVADWYEALKHTEPDTAEQIAAAIDVLSEHGPALDRPLVDTISGSKLPNLKELRPGSAGRSEIRILFAFDPARKAVLLVAGDKSREWRRWYTDNIALAEDRFEKWLAGYYAEEGGP